MTPILREALRRVRMSNDFLLLDCLELIDRNKSDGAVAMCRWLGHTLLGYGSLEDAVSDDVDCPACEGDGELEAYGANSRRYYVSCPECHGDGRVSADEVDPDDYVPEIDRVTWRDLNGERADIVPNHPQVSPKVWSVSDAKTYVRKEQGAMDAPKEIAA